MLIEGGTGGGAGGQLSVDSIFVDDAGFKEAGESEGLRFNDGEIKDAGTGGGNGCMPGGNPKLV